MNQPVRFLIHVIGLFGIISTLSAILSDRVEPTLLLITAAGLMLFLMFALLEENKALYFARAMWAMFPVLLYLAVYTLGPANEITDKATSQLAFIAQSWFWLVTLLWGISLILIAWGEYIALFTLFVSGRSLPHRTANEVKEKKTSRSKVSEPIPGPADQSNWKASSLFPWNWKIWQKFFSPVEIQGRINEADQVLGVQDTESGDGN